ncbi:MAG TPA: phage-shock protein [Candidatus Hydrogenedentes bacterium]|nr:phage-shock protein [Candidatus Hydrogenedentota bacterium]HRK35498.1 phage-shock protein [Candidatus Hydrogenedentota bacterium]
MDAGVIAVMIPIVGILCIFGVIGLLIVLRIVRTIFGANESGNRESNVDEAKLIQDIYHGLLKMEERVEALETLLLEREKKEV